ncbi:MAG: response regulator [Rickettsiales bacterium]
MTDTIQPHDFGEITSLIDVFNEAKKRRKTRYPQYVMVVEDDLLTRRILSHAFKENYALILTQNAHEAVADYLLYAPDVVFLDIGLPDASGFDVLKQIIACDPDAYVVMFSSNHFPDNVSKAMDAGASGFIAKPFKKENLSGFIRGSATHHQKYCV